MTRYLEKSVDLGLVEEISGRRKPIILEYYLLESQAPDSAAEEGRIYGIEIAEKIRGDSAESQKIDCFSCNKAETVSLIGKLASNMVTPVELMDVMDDLLGNMD